MWPLHEIIHLSMIKHLIYSLLENWFQHWLSATGALSEMRIHFALEITFNEWLSVLTRHNEVSEYQQQKRGRAQAGKLSRGLSLSLSLPGSGGTYRTSSQLPIVKLISISHWSHSSYKYKKLQLLTLTWPLRAWFAVEMKVGWRVQLFSGLLLIILGFWVSLFIKN